MLAREKTNLMRAKLTTFPTVESLRLPKGYVSLRTLVENGQPYSPHILAMSDVTSPTPGDTSSKRDRGDTFTFSHKGKKGNTDTFAHEASADSPFSRYKDNLESTTAKFENPSTKGFGNTLLVNIDGMGSEEVITVLHNVHAWALQRNAETKVSWSDIVTQIVWSFTGIFKQWWDKLSEEEMTNIIEHQKDPLKAIFDALKHEFVGVVPEDSTHHGQLFLSQRLCNIDYLHDYYCVMQKLLYQAADPHNVAYLRYYIASIPGKIPYLIN